MYHGTITSVTWVGGTPLDYSTMAFNKADNKVSGVWNHTSQVIDYVTPNCTTVILPNMDRKIVTVRKIPIPILINIVPDFESVVDWIQLAFMADRLGASSMMENTVIIRKVGIEEGSIFTHLVAIVQACGGLISGA